MAKHHASVAAVRFEQLVTEFPARVRRNPRIKLWLNLLGTEAFVLGGEFAVLVFASAFRAVPRSPLVREQFIGQLCMLHTVADPVLDAAHMVHFKTRVTIPHWFFILDVFQANQARI